jgi:hypothetical protein
LARFKDSVASHECVLGALGPHGRASARAWHRLRAVLPAAVKNTLMPPLPDDQLSRLKRCGWHDSVVAYVAVCDGQVRECGMGSVGEAERGKGKTIHDRQKAPYHLNRCMSSPPPPSTKPPSRRSERAKQP